MKVFVAGASGVIGRRLLPMLVGAGHEVTAMTRSSSKVEPLQNLGVRVTVCDVFDRDGLREAMERAAPEAVVHELTDLPPNLDPRKMDEQTAGNDRIRVEGTRNLMDAAVAAGVRRFVAQSIAFAYAPVGGPVKDETAPLYEDAPWPWRRSVDALKELERTTLETEGIEGVALRYGWFYGPGSSYASDGYAAGEVKKRRFPIIGKGTGLISFIHVDDAAAATVAAIGRGAPGIYNVVDDEPTPFREWLPVYADALGAKKPLRIPKFIGRLLAGRYMTTLATGVRGASNARAKQELGWAPRYPSWRQGFREALG